MILLTAIALIAAVVVPADHFEPSIRYFAWRRVLIVFGELNPCHPNHGSQRYSLVQFAGMTYSSQTLITPSSASRCATI